MNQFIFYWPYMALILPLPWLLGRFITPKSQNKFIPCLRFPYVQRVQKAFGNCEHKKRNISWYKILFMLLWLMLTLTLMRPQLINQFTQMKSHGYDLMLAVDLSGSMRALDFSTKTQAINRLDATKAVVHDFVAQRQGDRVGLILFGSQAFLHVPLTLDTLSVGKILDNTLIGMAGEETAIGDALGVAVKTLRQRPENSRVVILLTDGTDTASTIPPLQAAKLAKQYNIKVYTIGMGRNGPVPILDQFGRTVITQMPLDEHLLKQIAQETGGKYFHATDKKTLQKIYTHINKLEKTKAETKELIVYKPLYRYPLSMALIILLICTIFSLRRARYAE